MGGKLRMIATATVLAALLLSPIWAPGQLRRVSWFDVSRVEVSGTRLLSPDEVLLASGITTGRSIWDDLGPIERSILTHPAIAEVALSRALPSAIRLEVREKRPVAFVEVGVLSLITASGELLPVDPTLAAVDLPVIRADWRRITPELRSMLVEEADRLHRLDPQLFSAISEIRALEGSGRVLRLSHRSAEIVLPAGVDAQRLAQLRAVLSDLEGRLSVANAQNSMTPPRVDLRFEEQIVVSLPSSV